MNSRWYTAEDDKPKINQTGGYDFTDISPDDPNTLDPFRHLRFWFILDFFRNNYLTR